MGFSTFKDMNVYDFDGTIYNGDSTIDFYLYCLKSNPRLIRFWPKQSLAFCSYFFRKIDKTGLKEKFFCFLQGVSNADKVAEEFWMKNESKIYEWYKKQSQPSDIVISASPYFLLKPICDKLQIGELIASQVNTATGQFQGMNCHDKEKAKLFRSKYSSGKIEEFYSDSTSDYPMAVIAEHAFIVKKGVVQPWSLP